MSDGAHLPVEDANDSGLGLVEDDIVDLVVSMHERRAILRLRLRVLEEPYHLVVVWDLADWLAGVLIFGLRLAFGDGRKGLKLAVVEASLTAVVFETNALGLDAVEFGQSGDGAVPHLSSVFGAHIWDGRVLEDATVEERHDVKSRAYDGVVFTKTVCLGDWHVGMLESMEDAVFSVDLMGRLGEQLSRWLLAHDILLSICRFQEVCWVALAIAEL